MRGAPVTTPKALRAELGWSRSTMDRHLRAVNSMRPTAKGSGPWVLSGREIEILRAARRASVTPRRLHLLMRSLSPASMGVKQREATITSTADFQAVTRDLESMNLHELFGKAAIDFSLGKSGLEELKAGAASHTKALSEIVPAMSAAAEFLGTKARNRFEVLHETFPGRDARGFGGASSRNLFDGI